MRPLCRVHSWTTYYNKNISYPMLNNTNTRHAIKRCRVQDKRPNTSFWFWAVGRRFALFRISKQNLCLIILQFLTSAELNIQVSAKNAIVLPSVGKVEEERIRKLKRDASFKVWVRERIILYERYLMLFSPLNIFTCV